MDRESSQSCAVCKAPADKRCSACSTISYCSAEHQKAHWKLHKKECSPLVLATNQEIGKHYVATRDIKAGTVVLTDKALVFAPSQQQTQLGIDPETQRRFVRTCFGCHKMGASKDCSKCKFPVCGKSCEKMPEHSNLECEYFVKKSLRPNVDFPYEAVPFLRAVLLKQKDPARWNILLKLSSEFSIPMDPPDLAKFLEINRKLLDQIKADEALCSLDEWLTVRRIFQINCFGSQLFLQDGSLRCGIHLFNKASMFAHSCISNCEFVIGLPPNCKFQTHAAVPIKKGEILTLNYFAGGMAHKGTQERQGDIRKSHRFICRCLRCLSPNECGSHLSTLVCLKCKNPTLVPSDPLDAVGHWKCEHGPCSAEIPAGQALMQLGKANELPQGPPLSVQSEMFLKMSTKFLHDNHSFRLYLKRELCSNLCNVDCPKYGDREWMQNLLLMENLLGLLNIVRPGLTVDRAKLMHTIANTLLESMEAPDGTFKLSSARMEYLDKILEYEREALKYFQLDIAEAEACGQNVYIHNISANIENVLTAKTMLSLRM